MGKSIEVICPDCGGDAIETMINREIVRECLTCESTEKWSEDV